MLGGILWIAAVVCAVWVIYEIMAKQKSMDSTKKLVWIICAVLFSIITAVVYYVVVKKK